MPRTATKHAPHRYARCSRRWYLPLLLGAVALTACTDKTPPATANITPAGPARISIQAGNHQNVLAGAAVPLQVVVEDATTSVPVTGTTVSWSVTQGSGASVSPAASVTSSAGVAATTLTVGTQPGAYQVTAGLSSVTGVTVTFTVTVPATVSVSQVSPTSVQAGDTVSITGQGFSTTTSADIVTFGGIPGTVVSATTTSLRAVVPGCLAAGSAPVLVTVGDLASGATNIAVTAGSGGANPLVAGQVLTATTPSALGCIQLTGGETGAEYLVVVQNASTLSSQSFQLAGALQNATAAAASRAARSAVVRTADTSFAARWEAQLRQQQAALVRGRTRLPSGPRVLAQTAQTTCSASPSVGDRCSFNVYNASNAFTRVTAVVKAISTRAIVFQDTAAPSGGFSSADYSSFAASFDDPIYATDVAVYGGPSDLDGNGKIIILFTPVVNSLTPPGSDSYVAGFFFGCDLLTQQDCPGSNQSEIFYSIVPDPTGRYGIVHSTTDVQQGVPPVLAHEFVHMINFNQRILVRGAQDDDEMWMSEALADEAEDTVGGVYNQRGDSQNASLFVAENYYNAFDYLQSPSATVLAQTQGDGTLQERGAGWLFLKYLVARYGGAVLANLTQTTLSGTTNVAAAAGAPWASLFGDWSIALWADDAPDLASGAALDPHYTFGTWNIWKALGQAALGGAFPLQPATLGFASFTDSGSLQPSSAAYYLISTGSTATSTLLRLTLTSGQAAAVSDASLSLAVLRVK